MQLIKIWSTKSGWELGNSKDSSITSLIEMELVKKTQPKCIFMVILRFLKQIISSTTYNMYAHLVSVAYSGEVHSKVKVFSKWFAMWIIHDMDFCSKQLKRYSSYPCTSHQYSAIRRQITTLIAKMNMLNTCHHLMYVTGSPAPSPQKVVDSWNYKMFWEGLSNIFQIGILS